MLTFYKERQKAKKPDKINEARRNIKGSKPLLYPPIYITHKAPFMPGTALDFA